MNVEAMDRVEKLEAELLVMRAEKEEENEKKRTAEMWHACN